MSVKVDTSELEKLARGLETYKSIVPRSVSDSALRISARPMLLSARRLAPVGDRLKNKRAGATRRDLRIKAVKPVGEENSRVLVGVSKSKGKVGRRTNLITRGFTDRGGRFHRARDFLKDAYDYTIEIVRDNYSREIFTSFKKWASKNLPKSRFQ
ncbi:hypothetical protein [Dyadobacter fermentans]|uniref:Phage protein, HK97 gp10 family n=1 Tax=Dyadobacter fermentans (strain ATCC 700827 / DSM 18053 / CIP 107007 / KCTC 52180 / NS114) TaxID=471854 RepID=C6VVH3_DYAFD|nr:hypothetical protein [Dyadobacter fermentans]ACT96703.1 hypothetical protein Dfer_5512 [Dyadobacter fermentans DSM 18053]